MSVGLFMSLGRDFKLISSIFEIKCGSKMGLRLVEASININNRLDLVF